MSDVVRCGYTDTQWLATIALPRVWRGLITLAVRRVTGRGRLNGQLSPATRAKVTSALGLPSFEPHLTAALGGKGRAPPRVGA